jgi:hypothetical protein
MTKRKKKNEYQWPRRPDGTKYTKSEFILAGLALQMIDPEFGFRGGRGFLDAKVREASQQVCEILNEVVYVNHNHCVRMIAGIIGTHSHYDPTIEMTEVQWALPPTLPYQRMQDE